METKSTVRNDSNNLLTIVLILGLILGAGLIILNSLTGIKFSSWSDKECRKSALMISTFVKGEYDREIKEDGVADLKGIVKLAKKMDRKLTVSYFSGIDPTTSKFCNEVWIGLGDDTDSETYQRFQLGGGE